MTTITITAIPSTAQTNEYVNVCISGIIPQYPPTPNGGWWVRWRALGSPSEAWNWSFYLMNFPGLAGAPYSNGCNNRFTMGTSDVTIQADLWWRSDAGVFSGPYDSGQATVRLMALALKTVNLTGTVRAGNPAPDMELFIYEGATLLTSQLYSSVTPGQSRTLSYQDTRSGSHTVYGRMTLRNSAGSVAYQSNSLTYTV